jgi:hypothetical protein
VESVSLGCQVGDGCSCRQNGNASAFRRSGIAPGVAPVNTYIYIKDGGVSGGPSFVAVMQPADLRHSHD